jgi:hypothetical protein
MSTVASVERGGQDQVPSTDYYGPHFEPHSPVLTTQLRARLRPDHVHLNHHHRYYHHDDSLACTKAAQRSALNSFQNLRYFDDTSANMMYSSTVYNLSGAFCSILSFSSLCFLARARVDSCCVRSPNTLYGLPTDCSQVVETRYASG